MPTAITALVDHPAFLLLALAVLVEGRLILRGLIAVVFRLPRAQRNRWLARALERDRLLDLLRAAPAIWKRLPRPAVTDAEVRTLPSRPAPADDADRAA